MFKVLAKTLPFIAIAVSFAAPVKAGDNGIASALHSLRAESGRVCQVGHFHVGKTPTPSASKAVALRAAKRHWSEFTVLEYGSSWGRFSLSASKSSDCYKVGASRWECKVRSRPCRRGLRSASR